MKPILIIFLLIFFSLVIYFFILGQQSKSKQTPGLIDGHLSKCPDTPNCFNTEIKDHARHYISPIKTSGNTSDSLSKLKNIVRNMGGIIQVENENYFSAIFSSSVFGFVDDLEIRIDTKNNVIHIRSASRVGRSDMGINKKRIMLIKQSYKKKSIEIN
ncbi:MAG: DUF1499 domain-containing protein [Gammaproteobacteria bacterium]|nr:DUF1499 domain-containing protein [Gammaproteobacteria bacterium]